MENGITSIAVENSIFFEQYSLALTSIAELVAYNKALRDTNAEVSRFGFTFVDASGISQGQRARNKVEDIYNSLPDKIKSYLGSKSELIRNAQAWGADLDYGNYEKPRFMKAMPIMEKRQEFNGLMLEGASEKYLLKGE